MVDHSNAPPGQISLRIGGAVLVLCLLDLNDAKPGSIWVHAVSVGEVLAVSQLNH